MQIEIKDLVRTFVTTHFLKESSLDLEDDISFIDEAIIDSVGVLELVAFLEETFNFRVEDEEITPDNLDSVKKLVVYVQSKISHG